ncbi:MAG: retron St85 family RNA-directed DNA polymerase [Bordetella sp.]|uniref:retron St85 family RNA-directed DNA polymerase n=1 Tax=Bordetella sp. TaxID=28081 RepID=UPI003F7BD089
MALRDSILTDLPFTPSELNRLVKTAPLRYKEYFIPKKTPGEFRAIAQPTPEIKLLQRWLMSSVLKEFKIHGAATAYRKGHGLADNARPHLHNRFMLKLDFQNFFPSIKMDDLMRYLTNVGWENPDDMDLLGRVLFKFNRRKKCLELSIGAPSSPMVSNFLLFSFDTLIEDYCLEHDITYTRYADDLTFSTNSPNVLRDCKTFVAETLANIESPHLSLNGNKVVETSKKHGRRVTGLIITSDNRISIGRDKKRELRVLIHRHMQQLLTPDEFQSLKGYLAFLKSVEPEHLERLRASFGDDTMRSLLP